MAPKYKVRVKKETKGKKQEEKACPIPKYCAGTLLRNWVQGASGMSKITCP